MFLQLRLMGVSVADISSLLERHDRNVVIRKFAGCLLLSSLGRKLDANFGSVWTWTVQSRGFVENVTIPKAFENHTCAQLALVESVRPDASRFTAALPPTMRELVSIIPTVIELIQ